MPLRKLEPVDPVALATDTGAILARIRRPATTRGFQDALQRFGAYLNELPGNTRAPEDELKPEDRQMFECFLVHARKTYAHSTVLNAVLGPLNQFVSVVRCLRAARKMFFFSFTATQSRSAITGEDHISGHCCSTTEGSVARIR